MGDTGDQIHVGSVKKLDEQLKGTYLNNVIVSIQQNQTSDESGSSAYTVYLSTAPAGDWSDDHVITARSTGVGGGTVNLVARRRILTNSSGTEATQGATGPVHIWAEATDIAHDPNAARLTIEAWGRMHQLLGDGL